MLNSTVLTRFARRLAMPADELVDLILFGLTTSGPSAAAVRLYNPTGYRGDIAPEGLIDWLNERAPGRIVPGVIPINVSLIIDELKVEFGAAALLRARLIQNGTSGLELNPILKPGRCWCHFDEHDNVYQISSDHGVLRRGAVSNHLLLDTAGLRKDLWPRHTAIITFGAYELTVLRLMGLRSAAILLPHEWTDSLFEQFIHLLRVEHIDCLTLCAAALGREWHPTPYIVGWLMRFDRIASAAGIRLNVLNADTLAAAGTPQSAALQHLSSELVVKTIAVRTDPVPFIRGRLEPLISRAEPFSLWLAQQPARLAYPPHWAELKPVELPDLLAGNKSGTSLLLARVESVGKVYVDPRDVEWRCTDASATRPDCWACSKVVGRSLPCTITIPIEFLAGVDAKSAAKRAKEIRSALKSSCGCSNEPVGKLLRPRPWRRAKIYEILEYQDRRPERRDLIIDSDLELLTGKEYTFEVESVKSHHTGEVLLVGREFRPALSATERYRPTGPDLHELERHFAVKIATTQTVQERIDAQVASWAQSIGNTGGDLFSLVRWCWLLYLTPYCIPLRKFTRGGAASILILGDSSLGKSFTVQKMMESLQLGSTADAQATSATGLLAVPNGKQMLRGEIPRLDRELLFVDEAHTIDSSMWQALRQPRRDGKYEYQKVSKGKFRTRTRLIFAANPPKNKVMANYASPWNAVPKLDAADLARFDLIMTVGAQTTSPVPNGAVNIPIETLRRLAAHNWSKAWDDDVTWRLSEASSSRIEELDRELQTKYANKLCPLFDGEHVKACILSWAAAIANAAPTRIDDKVWIEPAHVDYAGQLLAENADQLGLTANIGSEHDSPDDLVDTIRADEKKIAVATAFKSSSFLSLEELAGRVGCKAETLRKKELPWFKEKHLLESQKGQTGGFAATALLKALLDRILA